MQPSAFEKDSSPDTSEPLSMLPAIGLQLEPTAPTPATAVLGVLVDPGRLAARAAEVAAHQRSPETRRTTPRCTGPSAPSWDPTPHRMT